MRITQIHGFCRFLCAWYPDSATAQAGKDAIKSLVTFAYSGHQGIWVNQVQRKNIPGEVVVVALKLNALNTHLEGLFFASVELDFLNTGGLIYYPTDVGDNNFVDYIEKNASF